MATTYTSAAAAANNAYKSLGVFVRTFSYPAPVFVINDVVQMIPVYAGETVLGVELVATDLDTNGTPTITLDVGDGDSVDRYIAASAVGQAGGLDKHSAGTPRQYAADDTIDVKVKAAPATGATGSVTLTVYLQAP